MIKYIKETQKYKLTLKINYINIADRYAGADFSVHADMKSHSGDVLTIGK